MNYVGKKVYHKAKFGNGIIIAQDQNNHITVQFDTLSETKSFSCPACFTSFLQLLDENAAKQAQEDARTLENSSYSTIKCASSNYIWLIA